jgi:Uma2 family endonuclease
MFTIHGPAEQVLLREWVTDIHAFRRWLETDDVPEEARVWWLKGQGWVDMSGEQLFTHVAVKTEVTSVLHTVARSGRLGQYFTDGVLLSNFAADISGRPDGLFLSHETRASDRVRLIEGKDGGYVELQGSPDMVLEVLSQSSEAKDTVVLMQGYWEAEVREYWLIDARRDPLLFEIYRHGEKGYTRTRKQGGWAKSLVFGKSFRLTVERGPQGDPDYTLEAR